MLAAALIFGVPWIQLTLNSVSTDDAYVNGHATFVAARVSGQIAQVLVDDNNRVHRGDLLVQLDKEPFEDAVGVKKAAVDTAKADLEAATTAVRGVEAKARSLRFQLKNAIEDVDNRIAQLHARVAALDKNNATLKLAQVDFNRAKQLLSEQDVSQQEYDQRQAALSVAQANVTQAMADVHQIRVSLGLPSQPESGDLGEVPPDLDQTFSSVREAQAALIQAAAQLGVAHSYEQLPKQMVEEFEKLDQGNIDRALAGLTPGAPAVKQAQAKLESANRDLVQAELNLHYCDVVAEIDGVVTRRNVNPGNNVQVGQNLMAIRSLSEIWVDANFKETQLRDLRIGQPVDLYVDMYGGRQVFKGRVSGLRRARDRRLRCSRPRMPPVTSSRWYSGYRFGLNSKDMTQTKTRYSLVLPSFHTSILTSRRLDPMLGSFYKPGRLSRKPPFNPRARLVRTNDGRGTFTIKIFRCRKPVVVGRRGGGADFHGSAGYDYRGGGAALHRWWPVSYGR
jgi:membrane fusion protein (multidrug efflux system)